MSFRGGGGGGGWLSISPVGPGSITAPSATVGLLTRRSPCCPALQAARQPADSPWILWRCDSSWERLIFSLFLSIHNGSWLSADGKLVRNCSLSVSYLVLSDVYFSSPWSVFIWWHKDVKCTVEAQLVGGQTYLFVVLMWHWFVNVQMSQIQFLFIFVLIFKALAGKGWKESSRIRPLPRVMGTFKLLKWWNTN